MISLGYTLSAAFCALGFALSARFRSIPGARAFMTLCALMFLAAVSSSMEYSAPVLEAKIFWRNVQQISYFFVPVVFFSIAAVYSMYGDKLTTRRLLLLALVPAVALALLFTNDLHHWMRAAVTLDETGRLAIVRTPLNDMFLFYLFLLSVVSFLLLLRTALFTRGTQRRQIVVLLLAVTLPSIISLLRTVGVFPIAGYGASIAITYLPSAAVLLWAIFKYQLLELVPLPRDKVVDALEEGIVVCDAETRVLDMNVSARRMLGRLTGQTVEAMQGKRLSEALPLIDAWMQAHYERRDQVVELTSGLGEERLCLSVKVTPIIRGNDRFAGTVSVLTDTTGVKKQLQALQRDAARDELTGVYRGRSFAERAERLIATATAMEQPLSLLVLKLTGVQKANEALGHQAVDELLRAAARAIERRLDGGQLLGRLGGTRFAALLPGVAEEQAAALAELIRQEAERAARFAAREAAGADASLRASVGVAALDASAGGFEALCATAERRLQALVEGHRVTDAN